MKGHSYYNTSLILMMGNAQCFVLTQSMALTLVGENIYSFFFVVVVSRHNGIASESVCFFSFNTSFFLLKHFCTIFILFIVSASVKLLHSFKTFSILMFSFYFHAVQNDDRFL